MTIRGLNIDNNLLLILGIFAAAWLSQRIINTIVRRFVRASDLAPGTLSFGLRRERKQTLKDLITSGITFGVYVIAGVLTMLIVVGAEQTIWIIGLFSAAFGIGANSLIRDIIGGASFLFEETIDVGDKVEILEIEGTVEKMNLRTLFLRATTGELYVIPNGDVRIIRNFSRGSFSTTTLKIHVPTEKLDQTLEILEGLAHDALIHLPNLLEPWRILSTSEGVAHHTELTLFVKLRYGKAAEGRPRLLKFIQERLTEAQIELVD